MVAANVGIPSADYSAWGPAGGVGQRGTFLLSTEVPGASDLQYRLNDGAEQVVPAVDKHATVTITPDRTGADVPTVEAHWPDGRTEAARHPSEVAD